MIIVTDAILLQIDRVVEAAMNVQAENGPDPSYRRQAKADLNAAKSQLINLLRTTHVKQRKQAKT
jgi:hypothetical protein